MKRLNKKGFTLIELLAVIVVLAILLVIAVPRVLDVIETARSESLGKSSQVVAKHLKQKYAMSIVSGSPMEETFDVSCPEDAGFNATEGTCLYTLVITNDEPIFTVTIEGAQRFDGWYAQSEDGANATISDEPLGPFIPFGGASQY